MSRLPSRIALLALLLVTAGGCEPRITNRKTPRPPADPGEVTIYNYQPRQYELLGTVHGDLVVGRDKDLNAQAVIEELRTNAAKMGGNGILLNIPQFGEMRNVITDGGYYMDKFYQFPVDMGPPRHAFGQVIWVPERYRRAGD
jgi:hypothetical protein